MQEFLCWLTSRRELQVSEQNYLQAQRQAARQQQAFTGWRRSILTPSLLRSEQRIAAGHPTQIQQVKRRKKDWDIEHL